MTSLLHSSARVLLFAGLIAILVQSAFAHTYLSSVYLNGAALAEGDCVRPHPATAYDSPIPLVTSPDMTCGWLPQAANAANRKCPIAAGSSIGLQFHHQSAAATDDTIDPTHLGPIMVYLAKSDTGAGNVWFKIYEDGYTAADGKWAVDRLLANGGRIANIKIPSDIAPGNYLLRGELIALHGAYALNGVQPYVGCVELTISGSGAANPAGVALPGAYSNTDPGMLFDLYSAFTKYTIPGPAVYVAGSSSPSSSSSGSSTIAPTKAPTTAPTSTTAPTKAPTTAPNSTPAPANGNIKVGLNGGSNAWWVGVIVSGGGEMTVKVEVADADSVTSWVALVDMSYAYIYDKSVQLKTPFSVRLTSSTGKQVTLTNVFTSFAASSIDTGKTYSSSSSSSSTSTATSAPTTKPTTAPTAAPTTVPTTKPGSTATSAPTSAPASGSNAKLTVYPSASNWWFAVTVNGNAASIETVELKDAGAISSYKTMTTNPWGYSYATQGTALVTPITVRVTTSVGKSVTATFSSITANLVVEANGSL